MPLKSVTWPGFKHLGVAGKAAIIVLLTDQEITYNWLL